MSKKIISISDYLSQLEKQIQFLKAEITKEEESIKASEFQFEISKNDLSDEVNSSLRSYRPQDLNLELPKTNTFSPSYEEIYNLLKSIYHLD